MQAKDLLFYYGAIIVLALILVMRRRPRRGMLLKLRARGGPQKTEGRDFAAGPVLNGEPTSATERPLNVVFNYNGHSWDAFEVLGLPAGSSPERVHQAYEESLGKVDAASKPFMDAAYLAILGQKKTFKN